MAERIPFDAEIRKNCAFVSVTKLVPAPPEGELYPSRTRRASSIGTAFFVHRPSFGVPERSYLLTCAHVISRCIPGMIKIMIGGDHGKEHTARVECVSPDHDVACLSVELAPDEAREVYFASLLEDPLASLPLGTKLYAAGFGLGLSLAVSSGTFDSVEGGLLRISSPINPGNSGGASFAVVRGRLVVVGINSSGITSAQNIGFAIPIDTWTRLLEGSCGGGGDGATPVAPPLRLGFCFHPNVEGFSATDCGGACEGVRVHFVFKESEAARHLRAGDVVCGIRISGENAPWKTVTRKGYLEGHRPKMSLHSWIRRVPPRASVEVRYWRPAPASTAQDKRCRVATLGKTACVSGAFASPAPPWIPVEFVSFLGFIVQPLRRHLKKKLEPLWARPLKWLEREHLVVTHVVSGSLVARSAKHPIVSAGMVVDTVNGARVRTAAEYRDALTTSRGTISVVFEDGHTVECTVEQALEDARHNERNGETVDSALVRALSQTPDQPPRPSSDQIQSKSDNSRRRQAVVPRQPRAPTRNAGDGGCALM